MMKNHAWGVLGIFVIFSLVPVLRGFTDPRDVYAISQLYVSLGSPPIPGWIFGGDPCGLPSWQWVECVNSNITTINLSGANLGGSLSEDMGMFASIILLSLNKNQLTGAIPDVFEPLKGLANMDLSGNNLTGQLPPSMGNLSSLNTLLTCPNLIVWKQS